MGQISRRLFLLFLFIGVAFNVANACSIVYYVDTLTGKIYVANNEDYFFNVKPYIRIVPQSKEGFARLWYGWKDFAQGGINEEGLFFDGATTPDEPTVEGYTKPKNNLGDEILAKCKTVNEALNFLEQKKIALINGHLLFGDKTGNAAVVEWVNGKRNVVNIADHRLMIANFLLTDTGRGNYPCQRYNAMEAEINHLRQKKDTIGLRDVGNIVARAVQPGFKDKDGNEGGTLYSTFINITDMDFVLVYKLDNSKKIKLDLKKEFLNPDKRTIELH